MRWMKAGLAALLVAALAAGGSALAGLRRPLAREGGELWYTPARAADAALTLTLRDGDGTRTLTLRDYLLGAVAAEMPASFEEEALRAQAVALRTYALRKRLDGAPHAEELCSDPACCAAWLPEEELRALWGEDYPRWAAKIRAAVEETDGEWLSYGDEPALTVFHASSPGQTEDSAAVWGASLPYLVSVPSPEDGETVPRFEETVHISFEALREALPEAALTGDPAGWFTDPVYTAGGRLAEITVGGVKLTGREVRRLFSLRSAAITITVGEDVAFTTRGSGHGVGMSQYGANALAAAGESYREILANYYPGTVLQGALPAYTDPEVG
ncbi:MAG: stage II sporulation protein D [bacterium]